MPFLATALACVSLCLPLALLGVSTAACGSSGNGGSSGPAPGACTSAMVPSTVHLSVLGFSKCGCFNGTFALTKQADPQEPSGYLWSSPAITGCPGQMDTAYLKFSIDPKAFGIGITGQSDEPDFGNSDFAPATGGSCSPLRVTGGGSRAGNINAFCPGVEDEYMTWSVGD